MASDWIPCELGDFLTLQRGFDLPTQDRQPGIVPIVSSSGISGTHREAKVRGPGVVTGRYGTVGEVFFVEQDYWPLNTTLWVKDFKGNDPRFAFYLLKTIDFHSCSDKSSVPGVNRNDLHRISLVVPPLEEQRGIARMLGALDDRIDLNRRINETFETMARTIFKDWFVDFGPIRAKLEGHAPYLNPALWALFPDTLDDHDKPAGWAFKPLDEIANFLNGLALQKYPPEGDSYLPVIKIAQLRQGVTAKSDRASTAIPPAYIVDNGDVLFSWSGSLTHLVWTGGRGALNQHLFKVTSDQFPKWFFFHWIGEHMATFQATAASKATTMGHIQRHHLKEAITIVPDEKVMVAADRVLSPLFERSFRNNIESRTIAELRDLLLPKLMSGEIRLKDAEKKIEEAL